MRRAVALALSPLLACAPLAQETRIERGPALRTFERQGAGKPGGIRAEVKLEWPAATLSFASFEVCRTEQVEEFEEERITERSSPGAGPSIGAGVAVTLIGGGLLLALPAFSNNPNTRVMDAAGRYGPSARSAARVWGIGLLVLGIPSVGFGAFELTRTGESTEKKKQQQVVLAREEPCHPRPADGKVAISTTRGELPARDTEGGKLRIEAQALQGGELVQASLGTAEVTFSPEDWERLSDFQACAQVMPPPDAAAIAALGLNELRAKLDDARSCLAVPGTNGEALVDQLTKAVEARRAEQSVSVPPPHIESWDEAVKVYQPKLRINRLDPNVLAEVDKVLPGEAVILEGGLASWLEPNIAVLEVGGEAVWIYLDAERPFASGLSKGEQLEVLGLPMGRQQVGNLEAPLLRVVWLRPLP